MSHQKKLNLDKIKDPKVFIKQNNILEFDPTFIKEGIKLGSGGFGKVVEGFFKSTKFAIKKLKDYEPESLFSELAILKIYTHPYIPRLYGINTITSQEEIKTKNTKLKRPTLKIKSKTSVSNVIGSKNFPKNHSSIDIILEIVQGFSLEVLVKQKKLTDIEKIIILLDLSNVLEYLHGMLLIHRDLKPANIMIDKEFKLKLLDFGISKVEKDRNGVYTSVIGTIMYMAPENFHLEESENPDDEEEENCVQASNITEKVDVWAFGCIVHELFTGLKPWSSRAKTDQKILSLLYSKAKFEISDKIKDQKLINLIEKCTRTIPIERITISEAKILLEEILYDHSIKLIEKSGINKKFSLGILIFLGSCENLNPGQKYHLLVKYNSYIFDYLRNKTEHLSHCTPRFSFDYEKINGNVITKNPKILNDILHRFLFLKSIVRRMRKNFNKNYSQKKVQPKKIKSILVTYGTLKQDYLYTKGKSCIKTDTKRKNDLNVVFLLEPNQSDCEKNHHLLSPKLKIRWLKEKLDILHQVTNLGPKILFKEDLNTKNLNRNLDIVKKETFSLSKNKVIENEKTSFNINYLINIESDSDESEEEFFLSNEHFELKIIPSNQKNMKCYGDLQVNEGIKTTYEKILENEISFIKNREMKKTYIPITKSDVLNKKENFYSNLVLPQIDNPIKFMNPRKEILSKFSPKFAESLIIDSKNKHNTESFNKQTLNKIILNIKDNKNTQFKSKGAFFSREIKFNTINLSNNLTSTNVTNDNISNKRFIKNKISSFNRLITETNYEKSKLLNEEKLKFRKK